MQLPNHYTDYAIEMIQRLCAIPSPSGYTKQAVAFVSEELQKMSYKTAITRKQTIVSPLVTGDKPVVMMAHLDTLGAIVRSIKSNGRLRISKIGGFSEGTIEGENCLVHTRGGKQISGTIQSIHPSVHVFDDVASLPREEKNIELIVDEKVNTMQEVLQLGIQVGDIVSFDPRTRVTPSGFVKSRHLDDKAGAAILLTLAKWIATEKPAIRRQVSVAFTSFEEVGHGGSSGFSDSEEEMISVDMGAVGDDLQGKETSVSICAKDSGGPYHYDLTSALIECAKEERISFAVDVFPRYGSDVEASLRAGYNVVHGLVGPGVFASHGYERTHREGIQHTIHLLCAYLLR